MSCQKPCQSPSDPEAPGWLMSCVSGDDCVSGETGDECPPGQVRTGWLLWKKCVPACGGKKYNLKKQCCVNENILKKCGAECYNPETECCKDGKKYEKCGEKCHNPKKECCKEGKKYTDKITNLIDCPNRYQKPGTPTTNGCSMPWYAWAVLQIKYHAITRDNPVSTMTATAFGPYCNTHDICYGTCYSGTDDPGYRKGCDETFGKNMLNVCNSPATVKLGLQDHCTDIQIQYVGQTMQFGETNYTKAQQTSCKCCP